MTIQRGGKCCRSNVKGGSVGGKDQLERVEFSPSSFAPSLGVSVLGQFYERLHLPSSECLLHVVFKGVTSKGFVSRGFSNATWKDSAQAPHFDLT